MEHYIRAHIGEGIKAFRLPRYQEIPDVGLYLEQVVKYMGDYLTPLGIGITSSMVSNYVKKGLVSNPVKKQYSREQIAYLLFIAAIKAVVSMDDILLMVGIQKTTYTAERAYNYFCNELENMLQFVFGLKPKVENVGVDETDEKIMLRNTIITVAHKVYLNALFQALRKQGE